VTGLRLGFKGCKQERGFQSISSTVGTSPPKELPLQHEHTPQGVAASTVDIVHRDRLDSAALDESSMRDGVEVGGYE
jgi:hypothetical protein